MGVCYGWEEAWNSWRQAKGVAKKTMLPDPAQHPRRSSVQRLIGRGWEEAGRQEGRLIGGWLAGDAWWWWWWWRGASLEEGHSHRHIPNRATSVVLLPTCQCHVPCAEGPPEGSHPPSQPHGDPSTSHGGGVESPSLRSPHPAGRRPLASCLFSELSLLWILRVALSGSDLCDLLRIL